MRTSGVLMHISSLPGDEGIGTLGVSAYEFVDFLKKADKHIGRYYLYARQDTAIRHISHFQLLRAIRILLILSLWKKTDT